MKREEKTFGLNDSLGIKSVKNTDCYSSGDDYSVFLNHSLEIRGSKEEQGNSSMQKLSIGIPMNDHKSTSLPPFLNRSFQSSTSIEQSVNGKIDDRGSSNKENISDDMYERNPKRRSKYNPPTPLLSRSPGKYMNSKGSLDKKTHTPGRSKTPRIERVFLKKNTPESKKFNSKPFIFSPNTKEKPVVVDIDQYQVPIYQFNSIISADSIKKELPKPESVINQKRDFIKAPGEGIKPQVYQIDGGVKFRPVSTDISVHSQIQSSKSDPIPESKTEEKSLEDPNTYEKDVDREKTPHASLYFKRATHKKPWQNCHLNIKASPIEKKKALTSPSRPIIPPLNMKKINHNTDGNLEDIAVTDVTHGGGKSKESEKEEEGEMNSFLESGRTDGDSQNSDDEIEIEIEEDADDTDEGDVEKISNILNNTVHEDQEEGELCGDFTGAEQCRVKEEIHDQVLPDKFLSTHYREIEGKKELVDSFTQTDDLQVPIMDKQMKTSISNVGDSIQETTDKQINQESDKLINDNGIESEEVESQSRTLNISIVEEVCNGQTKLDSSPTVIETLHIQNDPKESNSILNESNQDLFIDTKQSDMNFQHVNPKTPPQHGEQNEEIGTSESHQKDENISTIPLKEIGGMGLSVRKESNSHLEPKEEPYVHEEMKSDLETISQPQIPPPPLKKLSFNEEKEILPPPPPPPPPPLPHSTRVSQKEQRREDTSPYSKKRVVDVSRKNLWILNYMRKGSVFLKHHYHKKSTKTHSRLIKLDATCSNILIEKSGGLIKTKPTKIPLSDVKWIVFGPYTKTWRNCKTAHPWRCFSIVCNKRTLDIEALNEFDLDIWILGLEQLIFKTIMTHGRPLYSKQNLRFKKMKLRLLFQNKSIGPSFMNHKSNTANDISSDTFSSITDSANLSSTGKRLKQNITSSSMNHLQSSRLTQSSSDLL